MIRLSSLNRTEPSGDVYMFSSHDKESDKIGDFDPYVLMNTAGNGHIPCLLTRSDLRNTSDFLTFCITPLFKSPILLYCIMKSKGLSVSG